MKIQHYTGTIYHVHEEFKSGNVMVGIGSTDRLLIEREELEGCHIVGRSPMARMEPNFRLLPD
jgi:hypothetical protein